jgi:hypothetical protein
MRQVEPAPGYPDQWIPPPRRSRDTGASPTLASAEFHHAFRRRRSRSARDRAQRQLAFAWDRTVRTQGQGGIEPFLVYAQLAGVSDPQMPAWAGVVAQQ